MRRQIADVREQRDSVAVVRFRGLRRLLPAVGAEYLARMDDRAARRHDGARQTHEAARQRHLEAAAYWDSQGDAERAALERRSAELQRQGAELEVDRAALERSRVQDT